MNTFDTNKQAWNQRVDVHYQSEFYDVPGFLKGKEVLKPIELALLGNVRDKTLLHLQCHFGQDTLSLARLGAKVTGYALKPPSSPNLFEIAHVEKDGQNLLSILGVNPMLDYFEK